MHRGAEHTLDVSADLDELARTPVAVVCAGAKALLDLPKTLEVLETRGVSSSGDVRVRRGDQDAGGIGRQTRQEPLERGDGRGTHAAGGCGIQRVGTA